MENLNLFSDLKDKVAIVTGGYGYLGKAMVEVLSSYGCKVFVCARDKNRFKKTFEENNKNVFFVETNVADVDNIRKGFKSVFSKFNRIDILINNAYFGHTSHPEKMLSDEWRKGIDGGVNQYFDCIKEVIPYLKNSDNGKIINISSMYGVVVPDLNIYEGKEEFLNPPNYGTSKAAILHLTKYYAMYLGKYNINVNAVSPGPFPSEKVQKDKEFIKRLKEKTKLKRIGYPNDLKGLILLLSSEASNYITGQNIIIDGGWTI